MAVERDPTHGEPATSRRYRPAGWAWAIWIALIALIVGFVLWAILVDDGDELVVVAPQSAPATQAQQDGGGQQAQQDGGVLQDEAGELETDDTVRVTGTIQDLETTSLFADDDDFEEFEVDNALVAQSIEEVDEDAAEDQDFDFEDAAEEEELVGQEVTVVGDIESAIGPRTFTIEEP